MVDDNLIAYMLGQCFLSLSFQQQALVVEFCLHVTQRSGIAPMFTSLITLCLPK
jgi:hypothetical protein